MAEMMAVDTRLVSLVVYQLIAAVHSMHIHIVFLSSIYIPQNGKIDELDYMISNHDKLNVINAVCDNNIDPI